MKDVASMVEAALGYAIDLDWPIIPIFPIRNGRCACGKAKCGSPGKHPIGKLTPSGIKDATTDPDKIKAWWAVYPDANIALATGEPSGVFVVDIDPRKGGDKTWAALIEKFGPMPPTVTVITGGGGRHFYYQWQPGLRNTTDKIGPGVDTKSTGGYVLLPPSNHESGGDYSEESNGSH